jgi:HD-like signal output (HDOD) protein
MNTLLLFTALKLWQPMRTKISNAIRKYQHVNYFSIQLEQTTLACLLTHVMMLWAILNGHTVHCAIQ